ncbi:MAG TPA: methyltransferase domain-containing protein [Pyrinomonadaceae bacterium]|jgi:ubiquinone/menaquinone biosynthesis C-methylase UbiE/uncharacterized protein YbaR (Trm112 family)
MKKKLLGLLCCPKCAGELSCTSNEADEISEGSLECAACSVTYPIEGGIPRFVDKNNYSSSFGYQWNKFKAEQIDSLNGTNLSAKRFYSETGWTRDWLKGKWILDAGCGAGRFLDVASQNECEVVGIDISSAIDASKENLAGRENVHFVQASIFDLPFKDGAFDACYCIGVIQHTPNPEKALASLPRVIRKYGDIAVTIYERKPWTYLFSKYWFRPFTKKLSDKTLLKTIESVMPVAFPVTDVLFRIPLLGKAFQFVIPVANYVHEKDLTRKQRYDWAILDTFDMLAPQFDQPQTQTEAESALKQNGMTEVKRLPNRGLNLKGIKTK